MNTLSANVERRFYRDADRAILGGVCAGLARYLDFNLKTTRFLAFIAFLMAMPIAVIAYFAAVFLIPAVSTGEAIAARPRRSKPRWRRRRHTETVIPDRSTISQSIERRCRSLDERLIRLEKHVTSRRFQLDQELSKL